MTYFVVHSNVHIKEIFDNFENVNEIDDLMSSNKK